jgi:putative ABC transport system ATP-binding protein
MSNAPPADAAEPILRTVRLSKHYDDGRVTALADVDLAIPRGAYVAVVGKSGSGKSTLLNLLAAMDRPTSGEIFFEGRPLSAKSDLDRFRSRSLGLIFQSFYLLPMLTALENVQVPMFGTGRSARERRTKAAELLETVGIAHRASHLPTDMSVGERQRVAVARALANDPPLLLADEPTGNLDSHTAGTVFELFDRLHREQHKTLVIVTHDDDLARRAQRIVRMHDGRIVETQ